MSRDYLPGPEENEYWYNLRTQQVQQGNLGLGTDLWGPYPSYEEALHAMEKAKQRNEEWDENNDSW
ncbi:SPOR domain-containing protein [Rothia sp. P7181]|uniref:SPOR domain-containing protein n=1 Tax=unclassified Rothia (in: high G+C Gram-positive bacteria) TaxID=2689056 RepID=UPI003AD653EC